MITKQEYQARRRELAKRLPDQSVALIPAASESLRNGDAHYRFRQDSDFYYLTGFCEPDALLVVQAGATGDSVLFSRERHPAEEQWTGRRLGQAGVSETLGIDTAYSLAHLDEALPALLAGRHAMYYALGRFPAWETRFLKAWQVVKGQVRRGVLAPNAFFDLAPILGDMRLFKSSAEMGLMREAARISVAAHTRAMHAAMHLRHEYELEAELRYELIRQGCRDVAYDSIVAGGNNACTLHYTDNNKPLHAGELVLIDAGGEYQSYAADITRTFPANGRFSAEQRLIYELVRAAQSAGLASVKPGTPWNHMQQAIVRTLTAGLVDLKILQGDLDGLIEREAYKPFYMHQSGHWLGLDVHDCGRYKQHDGQWRPLESGMVLTVEPGLYISEGMEDVDRRWWGIGVRIEDDIHVTTEGHENLTAALAVAIDDIEALVRG